MKKIFLIGCVFLAVGMLWAETPNKSMVPSDLAVSEILGDEAMKKSLDELSIEEILKLNDYYSVKMQEQSFIRGTSVVSFFLPGVGNIMAGETLGGIIHIALELAIMGGTMAGAYFLTPEDIRTVFFETPKDEMPILTEEQRIAMLPTAGIILGGTILSLVNRGVSSYNAAETAKKNIEAGKITFEPYFMGTGLGMKCSF